MMRKILGMLVCLLPFIGMQARDLSEAYQQLENVLLKRAEYSQKKESRIAELRSRIDETLSSDSLFRLYFRIYEEYYTYRSDSALYYIRKAEEQAVRTRNRVYQDQCAIHRSLILSTTGYFSQSFDILEDIHRPSLDSTLLRDYYTAYEWVYSVWSEYLDDEEYAPRYRRLEVIYTDSLLQVLPPESSDYYYWKGEYMARTGDQEEAERFYQKALVGLPVDTRLYACVTCGIAFTYLRRGDINEYEYYLILAAISDMICPLKENLALQELAMHIFKTSDGDLERANRYLNYSMEDAMFYNNRLRMLEIARKFPSIVTSYQQQGEQKNIRIFWAFVFICILAVGLVVSLFFIRRQLYQLRVRRTVAADMNRQLRLLNDELLQMNRSREEYVSLFLDLCAAYIDKLNRFQELVRRKVKAKQIDDLVKLANSSKMPETDARHFFVNFDTAFLTLYPTFVEEFNALLREDEQIVLKRGELLNTELRIFALIRMGIQDSSRIATLLFYSPQTIYNYRTSVKNRARVREDFENQVRNLCILSDRKEPTRS